MTQLRLLAADDDPGFLREVVSLLAPEFNVVATAGDGQKALDLIRVFNPDVAVLDFHLQTLSGIQIARELSLYSSSAVVICSIESDFMIVQAARLAGVAAYVFKASIHNDLVAAVNSAVQGQFFVSQAIVKLLDRLKPL